MLGAMALFAILLIGILVVAFFRFQEPPQGPGMPGGPAPRPPARPEAPAR